MGKKASGNGGTKRAAPSASSDGATEAWGRTDHAIRKAKQQRKYTAKQEERERRSALLTRDSKEKRNEGKLRLHTKRVQNHLDKLRARLERWDDQEEKRFVDERMAQMRKEEEDAKLPKPKKIRNDPTKWKLKGAARPAWQVYDFDTRYVDPYLKAHADAKIKAQRVRNILVLCKGKFGDEDNQKIPQPYCREFLALLMQLGHLSFQSKQFKTARQAFLECMELDSAEYPVTPARCHLMKLYLETNRPESARRLWDRLSPEDPSVWIRYSAALIEFVSWKLLEEPGSTEETATALLTQAIQSNVLCAYNLAFWEHFETAMDHVEEVEDASDSQPLEEAIEYCNSDQGMGAWHGTEGALDWIKGVILATLNGKHTGDLSAKDLEWRDKLAIIKEDYEQAMEKGDKLASTKEEDEAAKSDDDDDGNQDGSSEASNDDEHDDDSSEVDGAMFAGMFETAMEMLEEGGKLKATKA